MRTQNQGTIGQGFWEQIKKKKKKSFWEQILKIFNKILFDESNVKNSLLIYFIKGTKYLYKVLYFKLFLKYLKIFHFSFFFL